MAGALNEAQVRYFSVHDAERTIFLSHKHTDRDLIFSIKRLLSSFNIEVYVDWLDDDVPDLTIGKTGTIIKQKIHDCNKFILVGTDEAINAKWCNWELGIGDEVKFNSDNIAILPIKQENRDWTGSEYMQRFPTIEYSDGVSYKNSSGSFISSGYYMMYPPDEKGSRHFEFLKTWLSR